MGLISGLIRGGLTAAGGAQQGQIAGEQQNYQRQVQMEQMARQEALTEAQIEQDKARALWYEGRDPITAQHYQDQLRIDQQKADDLKTQRTQLAAQHVADQQHSDAQRALDRAAAWKRTQAEIAGRKDQTADKAQGETRQQYLSKRIPQLVKPGKPDFMGNAAPGTSLQDAATQANAEYDTISGQKSDTPPPPPTDPRLGQWHQTMADAQQLHAKALANGVPQDQADAALGSDLLRAHKAILGVTGPMQPPPAPGMPGAVTPPGSAPPPPPAPAGGLAPKPISPIQPPLAGGAPPPVPGVLAPDTEEDEEPTGTAD